MTTRSPRPARPWRALFLISLSALFGLAALAPAALANENGDPNARLGTSPALERASWWPGGASPPFATLDDEARRSDRAILLEAASFLTTSGLAKSAAAPALPEELRGAAPSEGGLVLVQFDAAVPAAERSALLASFGAKQSWAVPRHARLARLDAEAVASLAGREEVVWTGRFHPAFKLSSLIGALGEEQGIDTSIFRLNLMLAPDARAEELALSLAPAGVRVVEAWSGGAIVETARPAGIVALARHPDVLWVEEHFTPQVLNDAVRGIVQGGAPGLETIHDRGVRGQDQIIAVMDSGIDARHCCFDAGKVVDNSAFGSGRVGFCSNFSHGTHVAGTAACANGGDHDGVAPDARIAFQDIGGDNWFNCFLGSVGPPSPLSIAWDDAISRGAFIHTNSWGGGGNSYGGAARAIDEYMWDNPEFLILYAAGNSGSSPRTLGAYSNAKNSLTIGATQNNDAYENMAGFSSRGPTGDGRLLPDLVTPGQGVFSAENDRFPSCGWTSASGTSMATPGAAGAAALVRDYFARGFYPTGAASAADGFTPTAALIKATMLAATRQATGSGTGGSRPNGDQGFGRLVLDDALWFNDEGPSRRLLLLDDRDASTGFTISGEEHNFTLNLEGSGPLTVMLAWTDAPGFPGSTRALVNDLDLVVRLPDESTYLGNVGFVDGFSAEAGGFADELNNREGVFLESVEAGEVTITVRAAAIEEASRAQDYALLVVAPITPSCETLPPPPIGNSVRHELVEGALRASWDEVGASSYTVYRGTAPEFMRTGPLPYEQGVLDADPSLEGVQWSDAEGADPAAGTFFYVYTGVSDCVP